MLHSVPEHGDFGLKLVDAPIKCDLACVRLFSRVELDAHLDAVVPPDPCMKALAFDRNMQFQKTIEFLRCGKLQPCAGIGNVANNAINSGQHIAEIHVSSEEAFVLSR